MGLPVDACREAVGSVKERDSVMNEEIQHIEEVEAEELPELALMIDLPE